MFHEGTIRSSAADIKVAQKNIFKIQTLIPKYTIRDLLNCSFIPEQKRISWCEFFQQHYIQLKIEKTIHVWPV